MKKIITIIPIIMLILATLVGASLEPHPINGVITSDGHPIKGADIIVRNTVTGNQGTVVTNENGFYQVELGNIDSNFRNGDTVRVSLAYCLDIPGCSKTVTISGGYNEISFDVITEQLPDTPDDVVVVKIQCTDGSIVANEADCPVDPIICADGTEVEDEIDCPEAKETWWMWILGVIAAFFAGAGGLKFYNGKYKHYHRGIVSYHDPNTRHTNPKYRHTRMNDGFFKCMDDVKKIEQGTDLSK